MATSDEWSRVGFTGNPVTGNPGVVENITKELRDLGDLAGRVNSGLDALLTKAEDGGFEGRTADALRTYVKDELKTFMANINRSFDMAANATARYARALGDSQDRAENAADTVAALERVGGQPLPENDPEMNRARGEVDAEIDAIQAEAKILEDALREAARLVSRPVKKPKKSFWKRFVSTFFKVLEIVALVVTIIAAIIGGPLGLVAFGLGAVLFAKALVDYATGNGNALSLGLAFLGILFPSTKGLTTLGGLARLTTSGGKALGSALSASGRMLFRGGRMLFSSPGRLLSLAGQGLVRFGSGLGSRAAGGFMALPRVLSKTPAMLGAALRFMGGFARNTFRQGWSALARDFAESTAFVGGSMAGRLGVFTVMSLGRLTMTALLPMRYSEIAQFGYRGAFRMGFVDRGMHFSARTIGTLGRAGGSVALDLTNLMGRNLDEGGLLRPMTGTNTDKLAVPGTPEFNATLDELADIPITSVTAPGTRGFSSLPGTTPVRMPGRIDDIGVQLNTLNTLDTVGLPVGTVPGGQRLGDQLRNLDTMTGLERTGTGLLKPLDDLTDLAELSFDGRLGGLTEFQVRKILDGEIDLVNVVPDGVVLRVGTMDPVDVRVQLKDGVKVDVLGPADTRVPTWNTTTGGDRLDELGIKLDDLTRLIPDAGDDARTARDLLGLGPVRTDLAAPPLAKGPGFTPLTLRDIVTGGATGKLATERFQTWVRTQATQLQLDTAGRKLSEIDGLTDVPPLGRAQAELDLSAAKIDFNQARTAFDRLGMNLDTVRRDVTVMMVRIDGPAATLPTGELRLLDDLGRPTGQWITMEPGPTVTWVLKGDSGVVPDVKVTMTDGVFTLTPPDGLVTRIGLDGRPFLDDIPVRLETPAGPPAAPQGVDPVRVPVAPEVTAPSVPQVHWLVRQDMDFSATLGKSGPKTRLTEDGLVPVRIDGTITPLQAVSTANAKVFKENSQFTAFSVPGGTGKPFGDSEIGLDLVSLSNDITAGAENVRSVRILSNTQLQQEILKEIRFAVGDSTLEIPSKFTHLTKNDDIKKFLAEYNVPKKLGASVTTDIKTLLQVRRDNTWLVQGAIPKKYLTDSYPTVESLQHIPAAPATTAPVTALTDLLESAGRASGSGMPPLETPQLVLKTDDFFMSNVDLEQLRGVKLIRQDDFHAVEVDVKGLRKSHFNPDLGMVPANPDGRTTAFQHVAGAEIAERKSNSPFTSFAVSGGEKVYGDTEFALDVYKLGLDIKAGNLGNVGILPARDLQQLIGDQITATIGKRLDFSGLTGASSRNDVIDFLKKNDVNIVGRGGRDAIGKIAGDVRVLLNTTRDQEWLIKGTIPRSYLEGPYPRATGPEAAGGPVPVGDALHGLDEAAGDLRLSDTFKTDFEVKTVSVEWRTPAGTNSGRLLESRVGELPLLDDLGRTTGQWITMEPGPTVKWVLKTDSGTVVPDVQVRMADGAFTVTASEGVVTRFGADGRPTGLGDLGSVSVPQLPRTGVDEVVLPAPGEVDRPAFAADRSVGSDSFRLDRFDAPAPRSETVLLDPQQVTGVPGVRMEWQQTPLDDGGFALTDQARDMRLVFTADEVLQFRDVRFPGADGFLRFEAAPGPGALPRVVGTDGLPLPGGAVIEPVRGALNVVTGVRVQSLEGAWIGRFDLDGTRLSEQLTLSGPVGGPLTGARLTTTFTQLPGGGTAPAYRLTVPGLGDGAFSVVRLDGEPAQRLPGGFAMTDSTGARLVFDRGGRFVDLPANGAAPTRLDVSGSVAPETTVGPMTALDGLGGLLPERLPLTTAPGNSVLDDVTTDLTGTVPAGEHVPMEGLAIPAPPRVAPPPAPAPPRVAPTPVPAAPPAVHMPETPVAARPSRAVAPGFDSSFPAASIGTESELSGFVVALPASADRTFAFVSKVDTDEPLLMVTKDMGKGGYANPADLPMAQRGNWQTHTVELITYPSRLGDQVAIGARNDATQWLLDVFKDRLGLHNHRPLESMVSPDGLYRLQVTSDRHVIAAGTGLELEGLPSVSMPTTQQQATIGIRAVDFGTRATHELRLLADHAHWYKPAFRNDDALRTALSRETLDAPEQVENAYTYTKSVIEFTSDLVNRHGIPIEDWAGAPPYHGLTHPAVKNEWKVLPRTRPSLVLDSLSSGDRAVTLRLLRETRAIGDESIWAAARQYILNGNEVAGRGINNATVGGDRALLFEFRTLPDELKGSVPHEKVPVSLVTDPLAELGGNRVAAVQKINDFVSGPENKDAFADWYRAEFPRDPDAGRIHQNKSTDSILRMAAARHKAEWIAVRHPQAWQDITARTPAVVRPPASAVPSAPPVAPHVAAGPLPDELGRPVTDVGGPGVPVVDLPRITQGPVSDLSGPTVLRQFPDSPVPSVSSVREIPLSGLDDVTGLRLRVTEVPATDTVPASVRIEVVDFTAQGGQMRLPDVSVTVREGGGFTATGPQGGVRWQFDSLGHLEYRELPLSGTDFALRFTDDALNPMPVVGRDGVPVPGAAVTPVRDATGALSELTVRVPVPGADGLTAVWRFEPGGLLRQQELPITLPGLEGSAGLGIKMTVTPGAGGTTTRVVELTGPQHLTGALRLTSVDSALSGRLPNGLTVTDTITHSRFHFDADHRLVLRDLPDRDGSGFLRFAEDAAPGTAPARLDGLPEGIALDDAAQIVIRTLDDAADAARPLDDLTRLPAPDAPHISSLPEFGDLGPQQRALVDDLWTRPVQDVRPVSPGELNRVVDPDSPRTDSLSELGELPDTDLAALQARLDNLRRMDREPRLPALDEPLSRSGGLADLTRLGPDGRPLSLDELTVPLSGVDDLADFELRLRRLPVTDATPPGSYRLELVDRTPGGVGPVRASDFTVELLDDSGRFAVIDPTGTTRFTLGPTGGFLGRETALSFDGLPEGLRLKVTVNPGVEGTGRVTVDAFVPSGAAVQLTPVNSALAARLPGGFTLTDTVTDFRFHFDHTGRLAFRDLPDPDSSGFLRFAEGAEGAPDTPPIRLDDLGDGIGGSERVPLTSENDVLDGIDMARIFDRTLDEASGFRRPPEGTPANMSDIAGLRPELLNDQLRQLTGQAQQALRQQAVTALGDYLDLPPATRLDGLQPVVQGAGGRVIGDFAVTPAPHGGPGGSRYTVHHNPSDVTLGFGPNRELRYEEVFLSGGPSDLDGLKVGITGRSADGGPWTPSSLDFVGARPADGLFTTAPNPRGGFTVTDAASTTSWHYGPEGVHTLRDVQLPGDRGILRFDADTPDGVPQVLDSSGHQLPNLHAEFLDDGRIALVPTGKAAQPMERAVFSRTGTLLEETIAVRIKGGRANGEYWKIDHATSTAVRVDSSGTGLTGRFSTAKMEMSGTGRFKLTGEGNVTLFEREVLGNGNVLHIDLDRVGRARWTEFDPAGTKVRAGERIWDGDRRTVHDTLSYRWAPMDVLDVRTYTKAIDGGLIRAEKGASGDWTWTRFDSGGTEVLSGTRKWSWNHIGFKDTYIDPVTGQRTVAHQRGNIWPLDGYHGSRQYLEHPVLPGESPAGMRVNPELHSAVGPANKPIDVIEHLSDGGTLHVVRLSDQRMPAALWRPRTGAGRFDGFFGNFVTGDSMFTVSKWTETAADGTRLKGVRLVSHAGHSWRDVDQFGRIVRETRKLENGNVVEVGRSLDDPTQWAPAPKWNGSADAYELPWLDTTSGVSGTRRVAGDGGFEDVFTNAAGDELLSMRSQGTGVREYLGENPARGIGRDDVSGMWVDKNDQLQITGRRDHWGDLHIEAHGNPRHRTWEWEATGPDGTVTKGIRMQNRGSLYSRTWDDSFVDFERLENGRPGQALRERNATDSGTVWIDATRQPDTTWTWQKTNADGTVHSQGVREYQDFAKGRWTDRIGDDVVRQRTGGRVREYAYTVEQTAPAAVTPSALTPPPETAPTSVTDLLSRSARHFEPTTTVTVDREVWREFDMGKVLHRRDAVEGVPGRYRESESLWGQWREYQDSRLVAQRTITGRVWATDAFGRWSAFDVAKLPEISSLPSVGGQVGLDGHRAWRLIGREVDFRGYTTEFRGVNREFRDPFHEIWTGVQDGSSAAMPLWRHELRKAATEFATGFLIEFGTSFALSAIVSEFAGTRFDPLVAFERALLNGAVGGGIRAGFNVAQDMTALGKIKYGLTNLDQGQDFNRHSLASSDDWPGEWASYENPARWRSGTYAFFDGLTVSALTGFVNNAANAAIWGVGGQKRTGLEALEAGAWGAAGSLFTGVTSGMVRYTFHTTAGSRIFHRGGPGELIWQSAESLTAGIINYWLNTRTAHIDSTHPFRGSTTTPTTPSTTTPTTTPSQQTQQPAVSPIEGLELT